MVSLLACGETSCRSPTPLYGCKAPPGTQTPPRGVFDTVNTVPPLELYDGSGRLKRNTLCFSWTLPSFTQSIPRHSLT